MKEMMNNRSYLANEFLFQIRGEKDGDIDVIKEVFLSDVYELRNITYVPEVIFDIGGHVGSFSVLSKILWPDVKIIYIEPNFRSYELAKKNLKQFENVEFLNGAMKYDKLSTVFIDDDRATGGGRMVTEEISERDLGTYYVSERNVKLYTVEEMIDIFNIDKIDIIKLDCEGGEKDFFTGLLPETAIKIRDFVGEYHYNLEDFYLDVRRVFNLQRISIRGFHRNIGTFTGEKLV